MLTERLLTNSYGVTHSPRAMCRLEYAMFCVQRTEVVLRWHQQNVEPVTSKPSRLQDVDPTTRWHAERPEGRTPHHIGVIEVTLPCCLIDSH